MAYGDLPPQQVFQQERPELERPLTPEEIRLEKQRQMVDFFRGGGGGYLDKGFGDPAQHVRLTLYAPEELDYSEMSNEDLFGEARRKASRIPSLNKEDRDYFARWFYDLVDRHSSQGRHHVVRSKLIEFNMELSLAISRCDVPSIGTSGIGALITQNTNQKTEMKMPQEPQKIGFWPSGLLGMGGSK